MSAISTCDGAGQLSTASGKSASTNPPRPGSEGAADGAVCFFVPGFPSPGGSKAGFVSKFPSKRTGKHFVVLKDSGGKPTEHWRSACATFARTAMGPRDPMRGPLQVLFAFVVPRPLGHSGTGRNAGQVRESAPRFPASRPDVTKLLRSTEDALSGIVWADDSQIVRQIASKAYGERPGCLITVYEL